ncbi:MAG: hypothetical protein FWG89_00425 [Treponema sp.]|nr:hypothetical protein [Treponema sp.]
MEKKHLFIINPKSFWNKWKQEEVLAKIHQFFLSVNHTDYTIHVSRFPRDATGFIPLFAKGLPDNTVLRVYAVGGDGILFDCLNGIMGIKNAELAAIPYGHTNSFTRGFGKNYKAAFRNIQLQYNAPAIPIDVMRCGNNHALSYCVVGIEAEVVRLAENKREMMYSKNTFSQWLCRRLYKLFYYTSAFIVCMRKNIIEQRYEITIDGKSVSDVYLGLAVFNTPYYGENLHPVSNAKPNDGVLDMLNIRGLGFLRTYCLLPFYISGRYKLFPRNFQLNKGQKISIRSINPLRISMDDVFFFEPHLDIEILPAAVRFVDAGMLGYIGIQNG